MKYRQTDTLPVAAAKASFASTAYRLEKDRRLPSQKKGARGKISSEWARFRHPALSACVFLILGIAQ
jgi:hypothetical protein